jgi:2,3,4,5-tetrahydropyridine-2-carboxylate N-succinyltransferase
VLEPVNASPVVIEDDAIVGGNCGVYEGTIVRRRAVLAAGVVLTRGHAPCSTSCARRCTARRRTARSRSPRAPWWCPGARQVKGAWAAEQGSRCRRPVIVKYRDEKTDLATALEEWLR